MLQSSRFQYLFYATFVVASLVIGASASAKQNKDIRLEVLSTFDSGSGDGGAEIAVLDTTNDLVLVTNGAENRIDIFPFYGGASASFDMSPYGGGVQSVAVKDGLAVAVAAADPVYLPGNAVFFDPTDPGGGAIDVQVGALPDMVTFDYQGKRVFVANEGEPRCVDASGEGVTDPNLATNPEGTVTIIDIVNGQPGSVTTVDFAAFNGSIAALQASGVRVGTWPGASVAEDLEPEYITVAKNGKTAYVSLQENNAVAIIDVASATVTDIVALRLKDHSLTGNALDASNEDDAANIRDWPVNGMYMPDAIASWKRKGKTYVATANEGDGREYFNNANNDEDEIDEEGNEAELCFIDEARVKDMTLDGLFPLPNDIFTVDELQKKENLGRLKVSAVFPSTFNGGPPPTDGTDPEKVTGLEYTSLANFGGRSVSIWDSAGNLVWDSGDQIAQKILDQIGEDAWVNGPVIGTTAEPDSRSDDKGAEPEAVAAGKAYGRNLVFVGLERSGGIMSFDATKPSAPTLLGWKQTDDVSPEGMQFIKEDDSPTGTPLLVVSYEVSGTTTIFEIVDDDDD